MSDRLRVGGLLEDLKDLVREEKGRGTGNYQRQRYPDQPSAQFHQVTQDGQTRFIAHWAGSSGRGVKAGRPFCPFGRR